MSSLSRRTLILGGLALGAGRAIGDPKVLTPHTFPALADDPRLDRPVSLRLKRAPLSAVLAELDRQTGARLAASTDTADEPAIVLVREQPAKELMRQLALLFD